MKFDLGAWATKFREQPQGLVFAGLGTLIVVLDQFSKWLAIGATTLIFAPAPGQAALSFGGKLDRFLWLRHPLRMGEVTVLENFWHFRYVENPGAVWGFLAGAAAAWRTPFFLAVTVVALVFIVVYFRRTVPAQRWLRTALVFVFAGALGNFLDRLRLGYVIDFIDWHWYDKATWPTFNIADAAISTGVVMMLLEMFFKQSAHESKPAAG